MKNEMTDEELIARLREIQGQAGLFASAAADRIEALQKALKDQSSVSDRLAEQLATCEKYRDAYAEMERIATEALRKAEARAAALLRDVPRYDTDPNDYTALIKTDDGDWLSRDAVLAALTTEEPK